MTEASSCSSGAAHPLERRSVQVPPRIYFARAIDGEDTVAAQVLASVVASELEQAGLLMVDPIVSGPAQLDTDGGEEVRHPSIVEQAGLLRVDPIVSGPAQLDTDVDVRLRYHSIVDHDLAVLRRCDAVLMDMSLPNRNYIGCVCEMTYAYLWNIPCVVYLGRSNPNRPWLHYHAVAVFEFRKDAIACLTRRLGPLAPTAREN